MQENILITLAAIAFIGISCQWLAWKVKLPSIIFLLVSGILLGPVAGIINPDELFGELLFPAVSLGVAIILFEGGLTLRFHEIKAFRHDLRNMLTIGLAITWVLTALATHYIIGINWEISLLFGALMTVTGPTVINPLLKSVRPKDEIARLLHWEGILLDVVGAILVVLVFQFIASDRENEAVINTLAAVVSCGIIMGAIGALTLTFLLKHYLLPHYLHHVFSLAWVLIIFAVANTLAHESGLLAVTLMGMILANTKGLDIEDILFFKESLSVMVISVLFIILAARLDFTSLKAIGLPALLVLALIMFAIRPLAIFVSTLRTNLSMGSRTLLSWIAPRGIVAAAVSALFAIRLEELGMPQGELLVPLTFIVIIGTVLIQGSTAGSLAKWLKVQKPEPTGVLFIGSNQVARMLANALKEFGFNVMMTDNNWDNISAARMEGLNTYYGRAVTKHADRNMDLSGIGRLIAASPETSLNALACQIYKNEFGPPNIFHLQTSQEHKKTEHKKLHSSIAGQQLFDDELSYAKLASLLSRGAKLRVTTLTDKFTFQDYQQKYADEAIPLFAMEPNKTLHFFTQQKNSFSPKANWQLASLLLPAAIEKQQQEKLDKEKTTSKTDA